jgi:hypothetical protein
LHSYWWRFSSFDTDTFPQRVQQTPVGQRRNSRYSRHLSSLLNFSINSAKLVSMKHLPKDVHKLKDKELAEYLFPKEALKQIKQELEKPKAKLLKNSR